MIAELDVVKLLRARPADGLPAGAEGTVVLVYGGGSHYEVEFLDRDRPGWTKALCTLAAEEVELVWKCPGAETSEAAANGSVRRHRVKKEVPSGQEPSATPSDTAPRVPPH
jgi:hypothetical protein